MAEPMTSAGIQTGQFGDRFARIRPTHAAG
jgi:hypothetical protein